jgi:periplasmic protein TonB
MQNRELFADAFISQPTLVTRLGMEFAEASREFRENPSEYVKTAIKGDGIGGRRRRMHLMYGLAVALLVFSSAFITILVLYTIAHAEKPAEEVTENFTPLVNIDDYKPQEVQAPKAKERAGGGGGGGRQTPTPPSKGIPPPFASTPPLIAPRPEPTPRPPALPVAETLLGPENLNPPKRDDLAPTGIPTGVLGPPSAGPGTGGGIGSGTGGGVGSGDGQGLGPGRGGGTGGGDFRPGGGDFNPDGSARSVDSRPVQLNSLRPNYTEQARVNKIQGVVRVRLLVGADGGVKQVRVTSGLPDGLNEEAILAVKQLRFKAAMKNGQPVAYWLNAEVAFNLR